MGRVRPKIQLSQKKSMCAVSERILLSVWISKKKSYVWVSLPKEISLFLFLHQFSTVEDSSLINGPSPNFQHVSLCIFSHEKASIHSHNSLVSTTKFRLQEFTFCMKLASKELSICKHIFRDSSMEIYKFKTIISIKLL